MRTPAGVECPYFYGDYFRGKKREECRLIGKAATPNHWTPDLCRGCRVPAITRANACKNMVLEGRVRRQFFGLRRSVEVSAYCLKTAAPVAEPEIGCGQCHLEFEPRK